MNHPAEPSLNRTLSAPKAAVSPSDEWERCQPGLLSNYAQRIRRRDLLVLAGRTAAAVSGIAALGAGGWMAYLRRLETSTQLLGMTCADVKELMPAYRADRLDAARSAILEKHVLRCSTCAGFRSELRG